ncbi:hypothetical protein [Hymenobacter lapidarius]|uniref:hypothetical protein n=1 Tax=Hymenobacter lapidarius TaxID=1908237 RepID=UPI000F79067E|nr:hypothetical protein [Hymenobacter lapidarius]
MLKPLLALGLYKALQWGFVEPVWLPAARQLLDHGPAPDEGWPIQPLVLGAGHVYAHGVDFWARALSTCFARFSKPVSSSFMIPYLYWSPSALQYKRRPGIGSPPSAVIFPFFPDSTHHRFGVLFVCGGHWVPQQHQVGALLANS